jgi:perosamine synthetase
MVRNIPLYNLIFEGNEKKYLNDCIDSGWVSSEGKYVGLFEKSYAKKVHRKYAVAVSSGTAALEIAVNALGIGVNDEVIIPTFTIISCALAVLKAGAKPVLVDCEYNTWNIDTAKIEKKITSRTRAIMVVHIYGLPVNMDNILKIAKKYKLKIIEDASEAHGLFFKEKPCGSFGDISIFSFYSNKLVTTGEGGMLLTDNQNIRDKCEGLRNLYFISKRRFYHKKIGGNFRMSNIQAALGLAQLERIDINASRKRQIGRYYQKYLQNIQKITIPLEKTEYAENIYWVYGVVLNKNTTLNSFKIMKLLSKKGICTRPFFWPMHKQPVYIKMGLFEKEKYPVSEYISRKGFYLPSGLTLTEKEIIYISETLQEILL